LFEVFYFKTVFYQFYTHNYYNLLKKYNKDFKNDIIFLINFLCLKLLLLKEKSERKSNWQYLFIKENRLKGNGFSLRFVP